MSEENERLKKLIQSIKRIISDLETEIIKAEETPKNYKDELRKKWVKMRFETMVRRLKKAIE